MHQDGALYLAGMVYKTLPIIATKGAVIRLL